jgi:hypothetical protein
VRLGELLVQTGAITGVQLEEALRQQVVYGARLGTNLIELGYADHDTVAHGLARVRRVPAALKKHLTHYNQDALDLVPRHLCAQLVAFPVAFANSSAGRQLVVCLRDPQDSVAIERLSEAARVPVMPCTAPELSILYMLERVLRIRRPPRYAQARPGGDVPVAPGEPSAAPAAAPAEDEIDVDFAEEEVDMPELVELDHADVERDFSQYAVPNPRDSAVGLSSLSSPLVARPAPSPDRSAAADTGPALDYTAASRQIADARDREGVSAAAIGFVRGAFGAGLMLIAKDQMALGHAGCGGRFDADTVGSILIPLTAPSVFRTAITERRTFRGAPAADGKAIHDRIFKLFPLKGPPTEVIVVPVTLKERVVSALYAHDRSGGPLPVRAVGELERLSTDVATAYLRLIRQAKSG